MIPFGRLRADSQLQAIGGQWGVRETRAKEHYRK